MCTCVYPKGGPAARRGGDRGWNWNNEINITKINNNDDNNNTNDTDDTIDHAQTTTPPTEQEPPTPTR